MKRTLTAMLCVALLATTTGCANMTPEEKAALGGAIVGGLAVAAGVAAARSRPVYVAPAPVYVAPAYIAPRHTNCTSTRGYSTIYTSCNSY